VHGVMLRFPSLGQCAEPATGSASGLLPEAASLQCRLARRPSRCIFRTVGVGGQDAGCGGLHETYVWLSATSRRHFGFASTARHWSRALFPSAQSRLHRQDHFALAQADSSTAGDGQAREHVEF
jgi:hypothetical protein